MYLNNAWKSVLMSWKSKETSFSESYRCYLLPDNGDRRWNLINTEDAQHQKYVTILTQQSYEKNSEIAAVSNPIWHGTIYIEQGKVPTWKRGRCKPKCISYEWKPSHLLKATIYNMLLLLLSAARCVLTLIGINRHVSVQLQYRPTATRRRTRLRY